MELLAKGYKVPQLDLKPDLPAGTELILVAYNDLVSEGGVRFSEFVLWSDRFLLHEEQFEYVWDGLSSALEVVMKWKRKSSSNSSAKTTVNYGPEPVK